MKIKWKLFHITNNVFYSVLKVIPQSGKFYNFVVDLQISNGKFWGVLSKDDVNPEVSYLLN